MATKDKHQASKKPSDSSEPSGRSELDQLKLAFEYDVDWDRAKRSVKLRPHKN